MTREKLEMYRSAKEEISELRYKLEHLGEGDSLYRSDVVMDYRKGYPVPRPVVGYDFDRERELRERYGSRIEKLERDCLEAEEAVEGIQDSLTRRIFRMYYLEGRRQKEIAKAVHMDRSTVSRKIERFFQVAHNSHDAHV